MKRGITFQIPNEYGQFIKDILEPLDCSQYDWLIGNGQILQTANGQLIDEELFSGDEHIIDGSIMNMQINKGSYYTIFADFKGFPKGSTVSRVKTYEDFLQGDCEIALLITDSVYVSVYCKDLSLIDRLFQNSISKGYLDVLYITDENDSRTGMIAW